MGRAGPNVAVAHAGSGSHRKTSDSEGDPVECHQQWLYPFAGEGPLRVLGVARVRTRGSL